jgi:DNA polymerase I-like protein with 3'-5' exonuclease and polymerase domains
MQHYIIEKMSDFRELQEYIAANGFEVVVLDLETDSVNEVKALPYGVGLCFQDDEAFYIPIRNNSGDEWWSPIEEETIIDWVINVCSEKKLIGHNIIYDVLVLHHYYGRDLSPYIYSDTILLKHMVDEEQPFGLKEIAVKYLGPWADKAQKDLYDSIHKNGGSTTKSNMQMFKADTEVLGTYCAWDVLLTYKLYTIFSKRLKSEGLEKLFYEDEIMPLYREVTIPMKYHGVSIDEVHFNRTKEKIKLKIEELENTIYKNIAHLIKDYEDSILDDMFPLKRTGNFPKEAARLLGLEVTSLAKKAVDKLEVNTLQQINFKDWLQGNVEYLLLPKRDVQLSMFKEKHPDRLHVFNFKSKDHLKHLFFEVLNEKPLSETEGGEPKVDDEFLASLEYPWVDLLRDLNVCHKTLGTYMEGFLDRTINGKLYTSFVQFGTTSGRFASRSPNLQNLSAQQKTDTFGMPIELATHKKEMDSIVNSIRHGMVASKGYKMIGIDYNSLEPHIAAYVSGDKDLIDIFVTGKDFYSAIAIKQFGLYEYSPFKQDPNYLGNNNKAVRDKTKTYSLATFYGATAPRISQVLNSSKEEAQELLDGYLDAFPGVKTFIQRTHSQCNREGKVKTIFGRVRHLAEAKILYNSYGDELKEFMWAQRRGLLDERKTYRNLLNNSVNFQIQGAAAHVINRAMIKIAREFIAQNIDARIISTIHDEVLIEAREDQVELAANVAKYCMENAVDLSPIKLKATPVIGNSYGDCK